MPQIRIKIPTTNCTRILGRLSTRRKFKARIFSFCYIKSNLIRNMTNVQFQFIFESVATISMPNRFYLLFYLHVLVISNTVLNSVTLNLTNPVYKRISGPNMCKSSFRKEFTLSSKINAQLYLNLRLLGTKWFNSKQVLTLGSLWQSSVNSQLETQHTAPPTPTIFCKRMTPWNSLPLWTTKSKRVTQIQSR